MTALHDIFEVKHVFTDFNTQPMENVYFYRLENENPAGFPQSQDLANTWQSSVLTASLPTYPPYFTTAELRVRNLFDPSDKYVKSLSLNGTRTVTGLESQPPFISAVGYAAVSNGLVRKGRKMFAAMLEADQSAGVLSLGGLAIFAIRAALYALYIGDLLGGAKKWAPCVVKRVRSGTPGNYTYRLPETQLEAVYGYITATVISAIVSSQDTRKD